MFTKLTQNSSTDFFKLLEDKIPWCPFTLEPITLLHEPIIAEDGHIYERAALEQWLKEHKTSPVNPNKTLSMSKCIPATSIVASFKELTRTLDGANKQLIEQNNNLIKENEKLKETQYSHVSLKLEEKGIKARKESEMASSLSKIIRKKELDQAAAFITQKRLVKIFNREIDSLEKKYKSFKDETHQIKTSYSIQFEKCREELKNIINKVPTLADTFKQNTLPEHKTNYFDQILEKQNEWKQIDSEYKQKKSDFKKPKATLLKQFALSAYEPVDNKHLEKLKQSELSTIETEWKKINRFEKNERLKDFIIKNAAEIKQLKEQEIENAMKLATKLNEEQQTTSSLWGGIKKKPIENKPEIKEHKILKCYSPEEQKNIDKNLQDKLSNLDAKSIIPYLQELAERNFDITRSTTPVIISLIRINRKTKPIPNLLTIIDYILDHGENINRTTKENKDTALHWAAYHNLYDVAEHLINRGADPNLRNLYDRTPLEEWHYYNKKEAYPNQQVKLLLESQMQNNHNSLAVPPPFAPSDLNGSRRNYSYFSTTSVTSEFSGIPASAPPGGYYRN